MIDSLVLFYLFILFIILFILSINLSIYTYKTLITLIVCLFETVRTNPGYGMATLISNNLFHLISGTVILLRSS